MLLPAWLLCGTRITAAIAVGADLAERRIRPRGDQELPWQLAASLLGVGFGGVLGADAR